MQLSDLHSLLRLLSRLSRTFQPNLQIDYDYMPTQPVGYSGAKMALAVLKQPESPMFSIDQADFMEYLGPEVCPRILMRCDRGYVMQYLQPVCPHRNSAVHQEQLLLKHVWHRREIVTMQDEIWNEELKSSLKIETPDWALNSRRSLIHGDPTFDNVLRTDGGQLRITDPIPPNHLKRPSIMAVDHGKILQSILGWEVVLRGAEHIDYVWPDFMHTEVTAFPAVFWCMIALKRIHLRSKGDLPGAWAARVAKELEQCVQLF